MTPDHEPALDVAELERLLKAADPGVLLLPHRLLRRLIKHDRKLPGLGLQVPHRKSYVIGRDDLLRLADPRDLGLVPQEQLPPHVVLLARPAPEKLAALPRGQALVRYWRMLFHARVHLALQQRAAEGKLTAAGVRD